MTTALRDADVLVFEQRAQLVEVTMEYRILDAEGRQVGLVRQERQSTAQKLFKAFSRNDQLIPVHLVLADESGAQVLALSRGSTLFKSNLAVQDATGTEVGRIVQRNLIGRIRFDLEAGGTVVGALQGENWRAWNFRVEDATGTEVARITKQYAGLAEWFSTADTYVLQRAPDLADPLATLTLAAAIAVDLVLKQDEGD